MLLAVAVIAIAGFMVFRNNEKRSSSPIVTGTPKPQAIKNTNDLDQVTDELDGVNLNEFDTSLNELSTDASGL